MGYFALALAVGATVYEQQQAAGAQQVELDMAKRQESAAAQDRELQRKRRLSAIIGAQTAAAAAQGLELSGSVANITLIDAKRAGEDSQVDRVNTQWRLDSLTRQRRTIGRLANARSAATIFNAAATVGDGSYTGSATKISGG